jgi:hypothetical protein
MKFKEILKRQNYPTWSAKSKKKNCFLYVNQLDDIFHFTIVCDYAKCKNENCPRKVTYASLEHGQKYDNFEECCSEAEKWLNENVEDCDLDLM